MRHGHHHSTRVSSRTKTLKNRSKFYRDALGFEVRKDVGGGNMRWITIGPAELGQT